MFGLSILGNRLSRIKHFRGHGVHSPYIYGLVRKVLMQRCITSTDHTFYDALTAVGVTNRRATELQNLLHYCGAASYAIDSADSSADIVVLTDHFAIEQVAAVLAKAVESHATLVVMEPYSSRARRKIFSELIWQHHSTTVDNRGYLIFFNNHLPKQHYKL